MNAVDFVQDIVSALANEQAVVTQTPDDQGIVIDVSVHGSVASVIGKEGRTIEAIRVIANALGQDGKHRLRIRLNEQQ